MEWTLYGRVWGFRGKAWGTVGRGGDGVKPVRIDLNSYTGGVSVVGVVEGGLQKFQVFFTDGNSQANEEPDLKGLTPAVEWVNDPSDSANNIIHYPLNDLNNALTPSTPAIDQKAVARQKSTEAYKLRQKRAVVRADLRTAINHDWKTQLNQLIRVLHDEINIPGVPGVNQKVKIGELTLSQFDAILKYAKAEQNGWANTYDEYYAYRRILTEGMKVTGKDTLIEQAEAADIVKAVV